MNFDEFLSYIFVTFFFTIASMLFFKCFLDLFPRPHTKD